MAVLRHHGTEVLLVPFEGQFGFPAAEIGPGQRIAEVLTAAMKKTWNLELACLFCSEVMLPPDHANVRYQVMQCWPGSQHRANALPEWIPCSRLSQACFNHPADYQGLQQCLAQYQAYANGSAPGPFAKPGWPGELHAWVTEVIGPMGLRLTGGVSQLTASPSFSLIRFETNGPALWFKAVGEPNLRELPITMALTQLFPNFLPRVLAKRPKWNGWLAAEISGTNLAETENAAPWITAAQQLAGLQISSIGKHSRLLGCGARDLRTPVLQRVLRPFLESMVTLMGLQEKPWPPPLGGEAVRLLAHPIESALLEYAKLGIPDSLGHLDLNPSNIVVSAPGCKFLDWAEAYVGNPFLSLEYLLQHFRRSRGASCETENQLREAYVQAWRPQLSSTRIVQALAMAPLLGVLAYASSSDLWCSQEAIRNTTTAGYFRSLTRRLHREAAALVDGRARC